MADSATESTASPPPVERTGATGTAATPPSDPVDAVVDAPTEELRRDRLLAALTLIAGVGLVLALPFALQAGARFFLPLTAAIVIAISS